MKAVQVMLDEALLADFDALEEVREHGRSAVVRRALKAYLTSARIEAIAAAYTRAYQDRSGLGQEWSDWEEQGVWPSE